MFDITDNLIPPEIDSSIELLLVQILSDALKGKKNILLYYCTHLCAFALFLFGTGNLVRGLSHFFPAELVQLLSAMEENGVCCNRALPEPFPNIWEKQSNCLLS